MLQVVIDATPVDPKPSGVGFYVANLISALQRLQAQDELQLGIAFQPGLKKWLRGDWSFPDCLQKHPNLRLFPMPVRFSNLLISNQINPVTSYFEKFFG